MGTLTNVQVIRQVVAENPGHTAYWYATYWYVKYRRATRMLWIYNAFKRATRQGAVIAEKRGHTTVYYPGE